MDQPDLPNRDISLTFAKGMAVLRAFDDTNTRLTLADISRQTGLDRAAVRRLVLTLVQLGYVRKSDRVFSLTPRVLLLAGSFLRGNRFGTDIQPLLNRFAARFDMSILLAIADDDAAVLVALSPSRDETVSLGLTLGSRLPLLHTAIGRMILAFAPPASAQAALQSAPLPQHTPAAEQDRARIAQHVEACRRRGHAIVEGEYEPGVTGFAVPVGAPDRLDAVVGTSCPSAQAASSETRRQIIDKLDLVAGEIARTGVFFPR